MKKYSSIPAYEKEFANCYLDREDSLQIADWKQSRMYAKGGQRVFNMKDLQDQGFLWSEASFLFALAEPDYDEATVIAAIGHGSHRRDARVCLWAWEKSHATAIDEWAGVPVGTHEAGMWSFEQLLQNL